jgi:hypothetical protein
MLAHATITKENETCPGCDCEVKKIADPADPEPKQADKKSYTQTHYGVRHGQECLLLGPEDCVLCILHLILCISGALFNQLIWTKFDGQEITKVLRRLRAAQGLPVLSAKQEREAGVARSEQLYEVLEKGGIRGIRQLPGTGASKSAKIEYKPLRLPGNESSLLLQGTVWEDLVAIMLPETKGILKKAEQNSWETQRKHLLAVMVAWRALYNELTSDWKEEDWSKEVRKKKGAVAAELSFHFVKAWKDAAGKATTHRYMHDVLDHVCDQIAELGSLTAMSAQGNEHNHSRKKTVARRATNKKIGANKPSRKPMAYQLMEHQAVTGHLFTGSEAGSRDILRGKTPSTMKKARGITGTKRERPAGQKGQGPTKRARRNKVV